MADSQTMHASFPHVQIEYVDTDGVRNASLFDDQLSVRAYVALGQLRPNKVTVRVRAVAGQRE